MSRDAQTRHPQTGDAQTRHPQTGDAQTRDAQTGNAQTGDAQTRDAQTGNAQTGDAQNRKSSNRICLNREYSSRVFFLFHLLVLLVVATQITRSCVLTSCLLHKQYINTPPNQDYFKVHTKTHQS